MTVIAMSRAEIDRMSALQDLTANRQVTDAATLVSARVTCFGEYLLPEAFGITATRRQGRVDPTAGTGVALRRAGFPPPLFPPIASNPSPWKGVYPAPAA